MKRYICMALVCLLCGGIFAGCRRMDDKDTPKATTTAPTTPAATTPTVTTPMPTTPMTTTVSDDGIGSNDDHDSFQDGSTDGNIGENGSGSSGDTLPGDARGRRIRRIG